MKRKRIVRKTIRLGDTPAEEQIREIELATARPIVPDKETPELTEAQLAEMAEIAKKR